MSPCPVCGSAACLAQSPNHCRTTNRFREDTKAKPVKAKAAREDPPDRLPPVDF